MSLAEHLRDRDALARRFGTLTLDCSTVWLPDTFVPEARAPLDFVVALRADHLTWLSPASQVFVAIDRSARDALIEAARAAVDGGDVEPAVDTAVGRFVTKATLRLDVPFTKGTPAVVSLRINHAAYVRPARVPWGALFDRVAEAVGASLTEDERRRLAWLGAGPEAGPYR